VTLTRGGPWDWSRGLREQDGFDEHGQLMDILVEEGFILLGGPLALEREVLLIVEADSEANVRERLAGDDWHQNGMLTIGSIRSWNVLLDGLGATARSAEP
jgi:uncharacterized protein YciI